MALAAGHSRRDREVLPDPISLRILSPLVVLMMNVHSWLYLSSILLTPYMMMMVPEMAAWAAGPKSLLPMTEVSDGSSNMS